MRYHTLYSQCEKDYIEAIIKKYTFGKLVSALTSIQPLNMPGL